MKKAKNHKRLWTPEQEEYLLESYGIAGIQFLMDRLGRSENAIKQKYEQLTGLKDARSVTGTFYPSEVAEVLGVNVRTIYDWIEKRGFPAKQLNKLRNDNGRHFYTIDPYAMWKWVTKNKQWINFAHVQTGYIIPEPDWLPAAIREANKNLVKRPKSWTKEEDEAALFWHNGGMHYKEIAKRLNRPEKGTWARINRLQKKRLEKKKNIVTT